MDESSGAESGRYVARGHQEHESLTDLVEHGMEVDGDIPLADDRSVWAIYGRSTYDGEILLAEFDDEGEAHAALRHLQRSSTWPSST